MVAASLLKEDADALASVDTADRLGEQWGDRDQCHLFRQLDGLRLDRVRDDQTLDRAAVYTLHGSLGEDAVRDDSRNGTCAARNELLGSLHERTGADREVVDDNRVAISDLADDLYQLGGLTVTLADLVCDCERCTEVLRESACSLGEAGIG